MTRDFNIQTLENVFLKFDFSDYLVLIINMFLFMKLYGIKLL